MKCATISAVEDVLSVVSERKMMVTVLEPLMIVGAEKKKD